MSSLILWTMTKKVKQILGIIIGGLLFLALPIITSPNHSMDLWANLSNPEGIKSFFTYILYLVFFFVHFYAIVPKLFFHKKYMLYGASVAACFIFIVLMVQTLMPFGFDNQPPFPERHSEPNQMQRQNKPPLPPQYNSPSERPAMPSKPEKLRNTSIWFEMSHFLPMFLVVLFVSLSIRFNNRWREVEQEKLNAELSYLKAQVNPHFLFNTLNSIYALAIEKSDETLHAITQLSSMMRYVLNETNKDFVPLQKEIKYISDYIELQKLRFGDTIQLNFKVVGSPNSKKIAPLILITFIENAFKHGVNPEENSSILIEIDINNDELILTVDNKKVNNQKGDMNIKSGLGIENAKNRLQLLYPSKHDLTIADEQNDYLISLKINLT